MFLAFAITVVAPPPASAQSVKLLAADVTRLHAEASQADEATAAERRFELAIVVEEIRRRYPTSLEARLLEKGRWRTPIPIAEIVRKAEAWAADNPAAAQAIRARMSGAVAAADRAEPTPSSPTLTNDVNDEANRLDTSVRPAKPIPNFAFVRPRPPLPPSSDVRRPATGFRLRPPPPEKAVTRIRRPGPVASAGRPLSGRELHRHIGDAVVLVITVVEVEGKPPIFAGHGSGSFISPRHILTNAHVAYSEDLAEAGIPYRHFIVSPTAGIRATRILKNAKRDTAQKVDAAVLEVIGYESPSFLRLAENAEVGQQITVAGYPGKALTFDDAFLQLKRWLAAGGNPPLPASAIPSFYPNSGPLSRIITERDSKALNLQYSIDTAAGTSGGPVVNRCGEIVGLNYAGTPEHARVKKGAKGKLVIDVTTSSYNFAVEVGEVAYFLRRAGIPFTPSTSGCGD